MSRFLAEHRSGWRASSLGFIAAAAIGGAACEGTEGPQGAIGPMGAMGAPGERGPAGADGEDGMDGAAGANGADGEDGTDGAQGPQGLPGRDPTVFASQLDARICGWTDGNRSALNRLLADRGRFSETWDPERRPVAVFDWDNTVMKNDIGDATLFWMIANDKVLQPPNRDWRRTSGALTASAAIALSSACDGLASPGEPLPTSANPACATAIVQIYNSGRTPAGAPAWRPELTTTMNSAYAWAAQLLAGYAPSEVRAFAESAYEENASAPIGARQSVGAVTGLNGYVRIYDQMQDLIFALQENGFDVWVVSASPQNVVEAVAAHVGVPEHRVIGIRAVVTDGRLTYDLQGCGPVNDAANTLITFDRGKRCWINKVIFHEPVSAQLEPNPDPTKRPVLVAGDSDTDIAMMKDATELKIAINRNKVQLMCNAYANAGGKWLVQPMFIEPRGQRSSAYACTTTLDHDGAPIVDETGNRFSMDYSDAIFQLPVCP
jgi:hypothetical protein